MKQMLNEAIIIARDWRTGRIVYCKPEKYGSFRFPDLNTATEWDGRGFATIHDSVMKDRLFDNRPGIGDVVEIDGRSLVIIDYNIMTRSYRALTESLEAHRLALFYITYEANLIARLWPIFAYEAINQHLILDVQDALMQGVV